MAIRFRRALLTNDDGIDAPGLAVLEDIVAPLADEVWVVAPDQDRSGISRAVTLHQPLRLLPRGPRRFACTGTPSDCVMLAMVHLLKDQAPDVVFSGVNRGSNLADEVPYSGTVAGAVAARAFGLPGIAFSQAYRDRSHIQWEAVSTWAPKVLDWLQARGGLTSLGLTVNVNVPAVGPEEVTGIQLARQSPINRMVAHVETRVDTRGLEYHWLSFHRQTATTGDDTDVATLRRGAVAVMPVSLDMTNLAFMDGGG